MMTQHSPSIAPSIGHEDTLLEIVAHLGISLIQADYTDDQIIIGHIRSAHRLARNLREEAAQAATRREFDMHRSSWTPSIVPNGADQTVYLVVDCDGSGRRCVWREADVGATDLETLITDLLEGQHPDPEKVVAFNLAQGWSRNVSKDIARKIRRRCNLKFSDPPSAVQNFVERNELREEQLTLRLA